MTKEKKSVDKELDQFEKDQIFNPLLATLRENDKNNMFKSNAITAYHKTGFTLFDHYFGTVANIHNDKGELIKQERRIGQSYGTYNLIVGLSGSGKTTIAVQIGANIIRQYPYSNIVHFDCENRFDLSRAENITALPPEYFKNNRYVIKNGMIGLDGIQETIAKLWQQKMGIKDQLTIKMPYTDEFGKDIMILQPSVIIIDSITTVLNETYSSDSVKEVSKAGELRSNTDGARDAKSLKGFFKDTLPMCKEANIIVYLVNHINNNMSMNAFIPVAKQQNFLKQDESIPGGRTMIFYPQNIAKLIAKPSDNFTTETDGFNGHIVMVEPIKSSSNQSGNNSKGISFELVFNYQKGFDNIRSLIWYGKENGFIDGNKNRMKFKDAGWTDNWWKDYESLNAEEKVIANEVIHSNKFDNIDKYKKMPNVYKVLKYYTITKDFDPKILKQSKFKEEILI